MLELGSTDDSLSSTDASLGLAFASVTIRFLMFSPMIIVKRAIRIQANVSNYLKNNLTQKEE
jgi:hypothetical protein